MTRVRDIVNLMNNEVSLNNGDTSITENTNNNEVNSMETRHRLNNMLIAKILEDRIVEHCSKYQNEQSQDLMNDIQQDLQAVRLQILGR
mgnify:CR=1 FL=1|jgi:hypothetical protein|tara:strand:+ start:2056 stop:2322 length:267 start_codon:yes stop_codon:yes gene_type:complete